ncbi:MAG: cytidine deaminase [Acholeplasmatales bacterium]|jgi:cytidine deaminase|nr:cytidine deaminase [Acholeplasmatales bacterium]
MEIKELIKVAIDNMAKAYTPYSHFNVSAVIVLKNGQLIKGVNVENASYGLSICAERVAMFNLVAAGIAKSEVQTLVVVGATKGVISPCGACRQVMSELLPAHTKVILANTNYEYREYKISDLLPYSFDLFNDRQ